MPRFVVAALLLLSSLSSADSLSPSSVCIVDTEVIADGLCEHVEKFIGSARPSAQWPGRAPLEKLTPSCLNREYACTNGYTYIAPLSPAATILQPGIDATRAFLTSLEKVCDLSGATIASPVDALPPVDGRRSRSWCKVAALDTIASALPACQLLVNLDGGTVLLPTTSDAFGSDYSGVEDRPPLLAQSSIAAFVASGSELLVAPGSLTSAPLLKAGGLGSNRNETRHSSAFFVIRNTPRGRALLQDWWHAVDFKHALLGVLGEPLGLYRTAWPHESRVLDDYITKKYPPWPLLTGDYGPPTGRLVQCAPQQPDAVARAVWGRGSHCPRARAPAAPTTFTAVVLANENDKAVLRVGMCTWMRQLGPGNNAVIAADYDEPAGQSPRYPGGARLPLECFIQ
jgi:hypothetical protein